VLYVPCHWQCGSSRRQFSVKCNFFTVTHRGPATVLFSLVRSALYILIPPRFLCWPVRRFPLLSGTCYCVSCFLSGQARMPLGMPSIQSCPACRSRFTHVQCTIISYSAGQGPGKTKKTYVKDEQQQTIVTATANGGVFMSIEPNPVIPRALRGTFALLSPGLWVTLRLNGYCVRASVTGRSSESASAQAAHPRVLDSSHSELRTSRQTVAKI
jgi:hypothetical protein